VACDILVVTQRDSLAEGSVERFPCGNCL
jgi:hypothetical protein